MRIKNLIITSSVIALFGVIGFYSVAESAEERQEKLRNRIALLQEEHDKAEEAKSSLLHRVREIEEQQRLWSEEAEQHRRELNTPLYSFPGDHSQNHIVRYASLVSGNNLDFLATIHGENGHWTLDRVSIGRGFDGQRAVGLCQFYPRWNKHIISDPRFNDYRFQVEECWSKFNANPRAFNAFTNGSYKRNKNLFVLN